MRGEGCDVEEVGARGGNGGGVGVEEVGVWQGGK